MRKIISALVATALLLSSAYSQSSNYSRKFPNRYELDLPNEWITTPKLINAITNILPKTLEVLKDKEFCTDCEAGYSVKLVVDLPVIKSRNNISKGVDGRGKRYSLEVVYQYRAALELYDSTGQNIIDLVLVMPEEEHIKKKDTIMYAMEYDRPTEIKDINGRRISSVWIPSFNPNTLPINNTVSPSLYELMAIAEQRVYAIKDILKKLD